MSPERLLGRGRAEPILDAMSKFGFYEIVLVRRSPKSISNGHADVRGVVRGIAVDECGSSSYAIALDTDDDLWSFEESELDSTGHTLIHSTSKRV